jgi:Flp pilus assembly protein TadB
MTRPLIALAASVTAAVALGPAAVVFTDAQAAREVRNTTRTSVNANANRNANVNRNVNANRNVNVNHNVNVNQNRRVDIDVDVDRGYHPVATAMAVTAGVAVTAAIVGSVTRTLPSGCVPVTIGTIMYQQCGPNWYQPQYSGTTVQYVVVTAPR